MTSFTLLIARMDGWALGSSAAASATAGDAQFVSRRRTEAGAAGGTKRHAESGESGGNALARIEALEKVEKLQSRQILILAQDMRMLKGAILRSYMCKAEGRFVKAMANERIEYGKKVKGLGGQHAFGPPDQHVFRSLISLARMVLGEFIDQAGAESANGQAAGRHKIVLDEFYTKTDRDMCARLVKVCQTRKAHSSALKRIEFALHPTIDLTVGEALRHAIEYEDSTKDFVGMAPPGGLETELEKSLKQ